MADQTVVSSFRLLTYQCSQCGILYEVFEPQASQANQKKCDKDGSDLVLVSDENISTIKTTSKNPILPSL
jgi:hypothetical protein